MFDPCLACVSGVTFPLMWSFLLMCRTVVWGYVLLCKWSIAKLSCGLQTNTDYNWVRSVLGLDFPYFFQRFSKYFRLMWGAGCLDSSVTEILDSAWPLPFLAVKKGDMQVSCCVVANREIVLTENVKHVVSPVLWTTILLLIQSFIKLRMASLILINTHKKTPHHTISHHTTTQYTTIHHTKCKNS